MSKEVKRFCLTFFIIYDIINIEKRKRNRIL
nr:MAG TPA: hypothetical protein [Caudoviricetes sp.]